MEQFTLKWNNYYNQISDAFGSLLDEEDLVDVTLSCEGKKVKAHKMLLSACSSYFRDVFKENPCQHPVIVFRNVPFKDLSAIVEFIYKGEVSVAQEQLDSFLATAEMLAIKGLTDEDSSLQDDSPVIKQEPNKQPSRAVEKRKTTETSLLAKKIKSPPTKKRRPESVGKPPDNLPVVLKVENITFEEDLNLDEDGNNLTEEVVQEFEQTETEEETSNIEGGDDESEHVLQKLDGKYERRCVVCSTGGVTSRSSYWCPGCNAGVHRQCFHELEHFWRPTKGGRKRRIVSNGFEVTICN